MCLSVYMSICDYVPQMLGFPRGQGGLAFGQGSGAEHWGYI